MGRISVILLLPILIGCSNPVATEMWGEQTMRLALALEHSGAVLQAQAVAPFAPDSAEMLSVRVTGTEIADRFARQVVAWKALDTYIADIHRLLGSRGLEQTKVQQLAHAFHDLHRHLLQTGITDRLGLSVETHFRTVQAILQDQSTVDALEAAQPAINTLCRNLAEACRQLEGELDTWLDTCLRQVDSKWRDALDGYAVLLARKRNLEREIAAQTAGATRREGDPAGELLKVETLLRSSEGWRRQYALEQESLTQAFRTTRAHVKKTAHAVLEWGIAHRELTKAMRSSAPTVNLRLLSASADELAPRTD